jgi:hypothetical protein
VLARMVLMLVVLMLLIRTKSHSCTHTWCRHVIVVQVKLVGASAARHKVCLRSSLFVTRY